MGKRKCTMGGGSKTERRHRLAGEQNWRCCYCFCDMTPEIGLLNTATIEHVIPLGAGGDSGNWHNQVAACYKCNHREGKKYNSKKRASATLADVWPNPENV